MEGTLEERALRAEAALSRLRPAWARIDLDRLAANYGEVSAASPVPIMPVVKADAYGHGAARVGRLFESLGAPLLAVAFPEEGVALRHAGVRTPIVVLAGFEPGQLALVEEHALTPVVSTPATLERVLARGAASAPLPIHLKVDTGMTRLGFSAPELSDAGARLLDSGAVSIDGAMTQLASADEDARATEAQLDRFDEALAVLARRGAAPRWVHAANSAGLLRVRAGHTLARPGLLLYGVRPRPLGPELPVRPAMSVAARLSMVREVPAGTAVSYGARWVAARPSRIGTVPLGYADGVPRSSAFGAGRHLAIAGERVPVTGAVCMDFTLVDVTDFPAVRAGDEAVLFGDAPSAWDVADWAGTTAWEVLVRIGARVPRVYVEAGRVVGVESRLPGGSA